MLKHGVCELFWNKRLLVLYVIYAKRADMAADESIMWSNGCRLFVLTKSECGTLRQDAAGAMWSHGWRLSRARISTTSLISSEYSIIMSDVVCRTSRYITASPL